MSLTDIPLCDELGCSGCLNLTHIYVKDGCCVDCNFSPIAGHNNELYLSYIHTCRSIVLTAMNKYSDNDSNVVGMVVDIYNLFKKKMIFFYYIYKDVSWLWFNL
jgi:hypothetical protein